MRLAVLVRVWGCACLLLASQISPSFGQELPGAAANAIVPPLVKFSGALTEGNGEPLTSLVGVTFSLYKDSQGGTPLWMETQNVRPDHTGHYTVMLGSTSSHGLPSELFVSGEARWLGIQVQDQSEQPRVLLLSVPYALKAGDAETVGGLPPSAFVLAGPASGGASASPATAASSSTPPPAGAVTGSGTANFLPLWTSTSNIGNSVVFQTGTGSTAKVGINTSTPTTTLDIKGGAAVRGILSLPATGAATATAGKNSQPLNLTASVFNSGTSSAVPQIFQWQAEPVGNNTSSPSGTLNLLFGYGTSKPAETGLRISNTGIFTFATGQTFPGTGAGTITGVAAGTDLTGGGTSGSVTLNLDTTKVPQLNTANSFTGDQSVTGNVISTGMVSGGLLNTTNGVEMGGIPLASESVSTESVFLGATNNTTNTGDENTATGFFALAQNTSGGGNTASGFSSLQSNSTGSLNTALGFNALLANSTGSGNTAVGASSLTGTTTSSYNTAIGDAALALNKTGTGNTAGGYFALESNTTGQYSTASGYYALLSNTTGGFNTAVGSWALWNTSTGSSNTAIGDIALSANTTGSNNVAVGTVAGGASPNSALTTGNENTYVGAFTSSGTQTNLTNATAIGAYAEVTENNAIVLGSINGINSATSNVNVGIGTTAPAYALDVHGTGNFTGLVTFAPNQTFPGTGTITGVTAGTGLTGGGTSGSVTVGLASNACSAGSALSALPFTCSPFAMLGSNTFTGNQTVNGNLSATGVVTGSSYQIGSNLFGFGSYTNANAFLGFAGNTTTTGNRNTAVGYQALSANTTGYENTATGPSSLYSNTTGANNTATGQVSLATNTTGSQNTATGAAALWFNTGDSKGNGSYNTADGYRALESNTVGNANTASGSGALGQNTTGSFNAGVGYAAGDGGDGTGTFNTFVGSLTVAAAGVSLTNATAVGAEAEVDQSNSLVLGSINGVNGAAEDTNVGIGTTAPQTLFHIDHAPQPGVGTDVAEITSGGGIDVASLLLKNTGSGGFRLRVGAGTGSGYIASSGTLALIAGDSGSPSFPNGMAMTMDSSGNVNIPGNLSKGGGSFKIDHPLDPANKFLYHSFVESPDMMNVYNGNVVTNQHGLATVVLADYFEALNRDFRYQLTVIGQFAQAIVAKEISRNRFTIRTDKPSVKVSWQVTGIRHDAYADAHRIPVEEQKSPQEQGRYLHPELFGAAPEQAIGTRLPAPAVTANALNFPSRLAPDKEKE